MIKTVTLPEGKQVPALDQGTWMIGERSDRRADEIAALREGVDLGMTLIETAEMSFPRLRGKRPLEMT